MKLYNKFLEHLILPFGGYFVRDNFTSELKNLRKIVNFNKSELEILQFKKLNKLLTHATSNSTYYKNLNTKYSPDAEKWLKSFPILDKEKLKHYSEDIITVSKKELIEQNSSGSSGIRSTVYWSKNEQSIHRATQVLWWEWAGYEIGNPILQTGLSPKRTTLKAIKDFLFRTYYIFAFSFTTPNAVAGLKWNSKKRNRILGGYASSLFVLSEIARKEKLNIRFKAVISWGDKLFDHYRKSISSAFGCDVYETYGTTEGMMIGAQYDQKYMYLMTSNVYLELLDDNGNEVEEGKPGHVVVTNLNGFAMPLIRYKIGDLAIKLPKSQYPENPKLQLPFIQQVIGRDTDLVKTKSGRYMIVHSFTGIFEYITEIKQFRIIQENLSGIVVEYIPSDNFNHNCLDRARQSILDFLNEPFEISFTEVDAIPNSPSGKPQIIVSRLNKI